MLRWLKRVPLFFQNVHQSLDTNELKHALMIAYCGGYSLSHCVEWRIENKNPHISRCSFPSMHEGRHWAVMFMKKRICVFCSFEDCHCYLLQPSIDAEESSCMLLAAPRHLYGLCLHNIYVGFYCSFRYTSHEKLNTLHRYTWCIVNIWEACPGSVFETYVWL